MSALEEDGNHTNILRHNDDTVARNFKRDDSMTGLMGSNLKIPDTSVLSPSTTTITATTNSSTSSYHSWFQTNKQNYKSNDSKTESELNTNKIRSYSILSKQSPPSSSKSPTTSLSAITTTTMNKSYSNMGKGLGTGKGTVAKPGPMIEHRNECVICLAEFTIENPKMLTLCACGEQRTLFHYPCLLLYLEKKKICPYCNQELFYQVMNIMLYIKSIKFNKIYLIIKCCIVNNICCLFIF